MYTRSRSLAAAALSFLISPIAVAASKLRDLSSVSSARDYGFDPPKRTHRSRIAGLPGRRPAAPFLASPRHGYHWENGDWKHPQWIQRRDELAEKLGNSPLTHAEVKELKRLNQRRRMKAVADAARDARKRARS